jgi:Ca2+-binding RTX toxin-like protein
MAIPKGSALRPDVPVVTGTLIKGTDRPDTLDDRSPMGDGGYHDPATDDTIYGYAGGDEINIHNGNDTVYGGDDQDNIYDHGTGNDRMYGEGGLDSFWVGLGNDTIDGGDGIDAVFYRLSQQLVALDLESGSAISEGIDTLISIESAYGTSGNDVLLGSAMGNALSGEDGDDRIDGRGGDDILIGGAGSDTIAGGAGADALTGGAGNDTLDGGTEADDLTGSAGHDVMTGGAGADLFIFREWIDVAQGDTIEDFTQGVDKIVVSALDARSDLAGDQAFSFDGTPDGTVEEFLDSLDEGGVIPNGPGPHIHGEPGEIEYKHEGGKTYIYLSTHDILTDWAIVLEGTHNLTAGDFSL